MYNRLKRTAIDMVKFPVKRFRIFVSQLLVTVKTGKAVFIF